MDEPNLRCPRNGKQTRDPTQIGPLRFHQAATGRHTVSTGKAMKVVLSARIPANKVVVRLATGALP